MSDIQFLMVPDAPAPPPTAPYSHAVRAGDFLFVTGQMPNDPKTGRVVDGGIEAQTHRVMQNLQIVLAGAGSGRHARRARGSSRGCSGSGRSSPAWSSWPPWS